MSRQPINTRLPFLAGALIAAATLSGCASKTSSAATSPQPKFIYLPPETGSRIPRRVAVTADGVTNVAPLSVQTASPDAIGEMQRRGAGRRGTGN